MTNFNQYSGVYHQTLNKTLSVTGENSDYFAKERVHWTLSKIKIFSPELAINTILDFGCGTGDTIPILEQQFKPQRLIGIDVSEESLAIAKSNYPSSLISFHNLKTSIPLNFNCELAYCNGVFHHIPLDERDSAIKTVYNQVTANGIFAFWENNPWNLGTQYLMNKCPFDNDAQPLSILNAKQLLEKNGFKIIDSSFYFIFPNTLRFLRFTEPLLSSFPIGAQYLLLAQKSNSKNFVK